MEGEGPTLKKFLYSFKRKLFLYFLKRNVFLYFPKWNPALISPNPKNKRNPPWEKFLYFRKQKPPKTLSGNRKLLIFQEVTCKYWKTSKKICIEEISCLLWRFCNVYISRAWGNCLWSKKSYDGCNINFLIIYVISVF